MDHALLTGSGSEQMEVQYGEYRGHDGAVLSAALSPDGLTLASASKDCTIRLWDMQRGKSVRTLEGHKDQVRAVCFSPDGQTLLSAGNDKLIFLWSTKTLSIQTQLQGHNDVVRTLAVHPHDKVFASGSYDDTVRLWNLETRELITVLSGHSAWVFSVNFSPCGYRLASCSRDREVRVWDLRTHDCLHVLKGHADWVLTLDFSSDGRWLASAGGDSTVRVWDLEVCEVLHAFAHGVQMISKVAIAPNCALLAAGDSGGTIKLWDIESGTIIATLRGHSDWVRDLIFVAANTLLSASDDSSLRVWGLAGAAGSSFTLATHHTHAVSGDFTASIAISPKEDLLTFAGDGGIQLFDMKLGKITATFGDDTAGRVRSVAFNAEGAAILCGHSDGTARLWDVQSHKVIAALEGHDGFIASAVFMNSPGGKFLASGGKDSTVRLWEVESGTIAAVMKGHTDSIVALAFSPDDTKLASGSRDMSIRIWDVETHEHTTLQHRFELNGLAFSPDGSMLVGLYDDPIVLVWDVASQKIKFTLEGHVQGVNCCVFTPDGRVLATAGEDLSVRLWDFSKQTPLAALPAHDTSIYTLAMKPGGGLLASCSSAGMLQIAKFGSYFDELLEDNWTTVPYYPPCLIAPTLMADQLGITASERVGTVVRAISKAPQTLTLPVCLPTKNNPNSNSNRDSAGTTQLADEELAHNHSSVLTWVSADPDRLELLQALFARVELPTFDGVLAAATLRAAIVTARSPDMVQCVAKQLARSARARDAVVDNPADKQPMVLGLGTMTSTTSLTTEVIRLVRLYPKIAEKFLHDIGVVRVHSDYGFDLKVDFPKTMMIVRPGIAAECTTFWSGSGLASSTSEGGTIADARVVPFPNAAAFVDDPSSGHNNSQKKTSLLQELVAANRPALFSNLIARAVVQHKWSCFARRRFLRWLVWYCVQLALLTATSITMDWATTATASVVDIAARAPMQDRYLASLSMVCLSAAMTVVDFVQKVREAAAFGSRFWFDGWNWLDLLHVTLELTFVGLLLSGAEAARLVLAVTLYLRWFGTLYYMQPFVSTGPLVRMVLAILRDMRHFLLILAVAIVAAWSCFRLLLLETEGSTAVDMLGDPANGLFLIFNLMVLNSFELDVFTGPYVVLVRLVFVVSMIVVPVVLLNLLIALMSDSYERIQDQSDLELQLLQAKTILKIEEFLPLGEKTNEDNFPRWLHVLVPAGQGSGKGASGMRWQGVLSDIKQKISSHERNLELQIDSALAEVRAVSAEVRAASDATNSRLLELQAAIDSLLKNKK